MLDPPLEQLALARRLQPTPGLVAPAVERDLVAGRVELAQRVRIQLGVESLDEERRLELDLVEQREQARQRLGHRPVLADRRARGPLAAGERGDLT